MKAFFSAVIIIISIGFPIAVVGIVMGGAADALWRFLASLL